LRVKCHEKNKCNPSASSQYLDPNCWLHQDIVDEPDIIYRIQRPRLECFGAQLLVKKTSEKSTAMKTRTEDHVKKKSKKQKTDSKAHKNDGKRLRLIREIKGKSQADFGEALGISIGTVANHEQAKTEMPPSVWRTVEQKFGVNPVPLDPETDPALILRELRTAQANVAEENVGPQPADYAPLIFGDSGDVGLPGNFLEAWIDGDTEDGYILAGLGTDLANGNSGDYIFQFGLGNGSLDNIDFKVGEEKKLLPTC